MAIHDQISYRNYNRVQNPSRATLADVVAEADNWVADASYSPYGLMVDNSGAEQMVKVEEIQSTAEVPPPLPLGQQAVFDDLLGITLSEQEITEVYISLKNGAPIEDVAVTYNITQEQAAGILTAMMNGSTPWDILNPVQATNELLMRQMTMSATPVNMTMTATDSGTQPGFLQSTISIGGMNVPYWALGLGAIALIMMLKKD